MRQGRALLDFLRTARGAWLTLALAMLLSAGLIGYASQGQGFVVDELTYYGRLVAKAGKLVQFGPLNLEYLLSPYNSHLVLGGRLVYELVFATAGADYGVFIALNVIGLLACVALVFELMRRQIGNLAALAPCVLLLFLGFANETLMWPFNLHTLFSLAFGLGAVLAVQRDDRRGDVLACLLLTLSVATIELGLAFALAIAVWLRGPNDRFRRGWIVVLPLALYTGWWFWATQFDQSEVFISNFSLAPKTFLNAMASTLGALTGTNPVQPTSLVAQVTWIGRGLAVVAAFALALRLWRRALPQMFWVWLTALVTYWIFLTLAARPPQGGRYIFVGAVGMLLIGAYALRPPLSGRVTATIALVALIALPANIAQLLEGRNGDPLHHLAHVSATEFAMLELAENYVDPGFVASADPRVGEAGGGLFIGLSARAYFNAAAQNGGIGLSLNEVRDQPEELREVADATLVGALGVATEYAPGFRPKGRCHYFEPHGDGGIATFVLPARGVVIRVTGHNWAHLWLRRFSNTPRSVTLGRLPPNRWVQVAIPVTAGPEPWRGAINAPVKVCARF